MAVSNRSKYIDREKKSKQYEIWNEGGRRKFSPLFDSNYALCSLETFNLPSIRSVCFRCLKKSEFEELLKELSAFSIKIVFEVKFCGVLKF